MTANDAPMRAAKPGFSSTPIIIGLIGFLTLVDLFAAQAILPSLAVQFNATPSQIGFAANASTLGMALGALGVAAFGRHLDRRRGIATALALLALPTALLAGAPDLATFAALRIAQGLPLRDAVARARDYVREAIRTAPGLGRGNGPLNHAHTVAGRPV